MALAPEEITAAFRAELGGGVLGTSTLYDQATVVVDRSAWTQAFRFAKESAHVACDFLTFVSAIDWIEPEETAGKAEPSESGEEPGEDVPAAETYPVPDSPTYQVVGRVYSTAKKHGVTIKADCPKEDATVDTLIGVYAGADWHEREMMEMFGIDVTGHPNKAKLYLPDEFEGHPLRKDFRLGARQVKPWPGAVDVEGMPEDAPVLDDAGNVLEEYSQPPEGEGPAQGGSARPDDRTADGGEPS